MKNIELKLRRLADGKIFVINCHNWSNDAFKVRANGVKGVCGYDEYIEYDLRHFEIVKDEKEAIRPTITIKQFLNSPRFKKDYKCWGYAKKLYDQDGNELDVDEYEFYDDEVWEKFITTHEVLKVEMGWELGDDHESYAFAKITTRV